MIRLFYNFFIPTDECRREDISYCLKKNLSNEFIDEVIIFGEDSDLFMVDEKTRQSPPSISYVNYDGRPTYEDIWSLIASRATVGDISIFLNSDCFLDRESMALLSRVSSTEAWCLSRWDLDEKLNATLRNVSCSQDCWIIRGSPRKLSNISFPTGHPGCDNRFAHELYVGGYSLKNPSKTFKVYHRHFTERPPGYWAAPRIGGPYRFVDVESLITKKDENTNP